MFAKLTLLIFFKYVASKTIGRLPIKGVEHDLWVGTNDPKYVQIQDNGFVLHGGGNLSLFRTPLDTYRLDQAWPVSYCYFARLCQNHNM